MAPLRGGAARAHSTACLLGCAWMAASQLRLRGARPLGTHPVGPGLRALAVDPRSGDLFVAGVARLDAFDPLGTRRYTAPLGDALGVALDAATRRLLIPVGGDTLQVRAERTGALVATAVVGTSPFAVAVEAQRGHALVATAGSSDLSPAPCDSAVLTSLDADRRQRLRSAVAPDISASSVSMLDAGQ